MVYYFILGHLDDENSNKFISEEDEEPAALSKAISSFRSTVKPLRGLSPSLFGADIMIQVLTFFVLSILPDTCRHVSTTVFNSIKVSAKIPTVEELFNKVELDFLQRSGTEDEAALALKLLPKPKKEICF
ncbi:hypothetical protein O181_017138 [Austropuccinia psidii MF-1]|uniref:Uncharacterized protein n=1 Tax=Austropuccinia psidii MF-1 TaxID=1389203 RepID=A0A9Q3C5L9_9BASI|nr:hypothetical protein [Austropuccinia psidii MF-1]